MSLLDGLRDSLKNPLVENNEDMAFALESDFEVALEKAIDARLSPEDIAAILNGVDDIDDEDDDIDDDSDDIDADTVKNLEACAKSCESTMSTLGIDTAGDELDEDDNVEDPELDPEGIDELVSEEALIAMCEAICSEIDCEDDADDSDDTAEEDSINIDDLDAQYEAILAAYENSSDDSPEIDNDPTATEGSDSNDDANTIDENVEVKAIAENDDEDEDDDDDEASLESILESLMENPI